MRGADSAWLLKLSHLTDEETQTLRGTVISLGQKFHGCQAWPWLYGLNTSATQATFIRFQTNVPQVQPYSSLKIRPVLGK